MGGWREDGERKKRRREEAALVLKGEERDYPAIVTAEEQLLTQRRERVRRHGLFVCFEEKEGDDMFTGFLQC